MEEKKSNDIIPETSDEKKPKTQQSFTILGMFWAVVEQLTNEWLNGKEQTSKLCVNHEAWYSRTNWSRSN